MALITGEEKIVPKGARYRVCTVEALPTETDASFLAIDEIQIAADLERGHVFTDRILNLRGRDETLLLGAATMRHVIETLIPGVNVVTRPRMSVLTYTGSKKITRLPRRSAAVAFSADEVYAIGELIRRQRGGVAVVLGALSPRTRNAQVEMYQNGDVDFLVATDAIGMGLNLDLDHVAFASDRKFDGYQHRRLSAAELAQIAGRAGRHMKDGTFGVTGRVDPFEDELVEALEVHHFGAIKAVQWRSSSVDYSSLTALRDSLERPPLRDGLVKAPPADDLHVLEAAIRDTEIAALADDRERVALLWDVCHLPDYRRIAPANHAELVLTVFRDLARDGAVNEDWFADQVSHADRTDGDIDTLSNRIAHIRTWNYVANRSNWLANQVHWQERSRAIEDRLSDALHERLIQRFVDRRTSVLMRRLRENAMLEAEITEGGDVTVEGQHVGELQGFRFIPDPGADGPDAKALRAAAQKALAGEIKRRADGIANAGNEQFALASDGTLRWRGIAVARLVAGDEDALKPRVFLLADDSLTGPDQEAVGHRLDLWITQHCQTLLKPLYDLRVAEDMAPGARGLAYRLVEAFGVLERKEVAEEVRELEQDVRAALRARGVRFGAYHIYVPLLLKPGPSGLLAILWALKNGDLDTPGVSELPAMSAAGRTTIPYDASMPKPLYRVVGFRVAGERAIRIDILERLADLIRPLLAWRPSADQSEPPEGVERGGFRVTPQMTSLLGTSVEGVGSVLKSLGYRSERRSVPPAEPVPASPKPSDDAAKADGPDAAPDGEAAAPSTTDAAASSVEAGETGSTGGAEPAAAPAPNEADSNSDQDALSAALAELTGDAPVTVAGPPAAPETTETANDGSDAPEQSIDAQSNSAADVPPAEDAVIEVWRPHRGPPRDGGAHRSNRKEQSGKDGRDGETGRGNRRKPSVARPDGQKRGNRQTGNRQTGKRPDKNNTPRPARVDPDSPFAALAALKADLEQRGSE